MVNVILFMPQREAFYNAASNIHFEANGRLYFTTKEGLSIDTTVPYLVSEDAGEKPSEPATATVPSSGATSE